MKETILALLRKIQPVTLATCERDQPRLRPMTLIVKDQRFYFATGSTDSKSTQLATNPRAEFCLNITTEANSGYLRGSGEMKRVTDQSIRKEIADWAEFIYQFWADSTDPDYCLYELELRQTRYIAPGEMKETISEW